MSYAKRLLEELEKYDEVEIADYLLASETMLQESITEHVITKTSETPSG